MAKAKQDFHGKDIKNAWNAIKEELAVEDGTEPKKGVDKFEREI